MKFIPLLFIATIVTSGCSSIEHLMPPSKVQGDSIIKVVEETGKLAPINKDDEQKINWAKKLYTAKFLSDNGNFEDACPIYADLYLDTDFPLRYYALFKRMETCSLDDHSVETIWDNESNKIPYWLRKRFFHHSLVMATERKKFAYLAPFSKEVSTFTKNKSERENFRKNAYDFAKRYLEKDEVKVYQDYLLTKHPRFNKTINDKNMYSIARDHEKERNFNKARKLYFKIIKKKSSSFKDKVNAHNRIRLSYKLQRDRKTYYIYTKRMVNFIENILLHHPHNKEYKKCWIKYTTKLARIHWNQSRPKRALKLLNELLKTEMEDQEKLAQIYRVVAGIHKEAGRYDQAIHNLSTATSLEIKNSETKDDLIWRIGHYHYKNKQYRKALDVFEDLEDETEDRFLKYRLTLWQAKCYQKLDDNSEYEDLLEELVEEDKFGYYGIMARMLLKVPFEPLPPQTFNPEPKYPIFEWLININEFEMAEAYLHRVSRRAKEIEDIEYFLKLYNKAKVYDRPIFLFYKIPAIDRMESTHKFYSLVFPTPFNHYIKRASERFDFDQEFIYSIIRQESAFNPYAKSPADAYGLMQLIPKRGTELSRKYKIPYSDFNDLYFERTNIFMGTALLKELFTKYKNRFVFATATYNAGPTPVKNWKRKLFNGDSVEFIEEIPYLETRNYVKLVLRNYITYKRLLAKEPFLFPTELFNGKKELNR